MKELLDSKREVEDHILAASDMHIGGSGNESAICEFLQMVRREKPKRLILCGDILDLWLARWQEIESSSAYQELLITVQQVPTVIVRGNHDYRLAQWQVPGAKIVDEYEEDGTFFIHGWQFDSLQVLLRPLFPIITACLPHVYQFLMRHGFFKAHSATLQKRIVSICYFLLIPLSPLVMAYLPKVYRLFGMWPFRVDFSLRDELKAVKLAAHLKLSAHAIDTVFTAWKRRDKANESLT